MLLVTVPNKVLKQEILIESKLVEHKSKNGGIMVIIPTCVGLVKRRIWVIIHEDLLLSKVLCFGHFIDYLHACAFLLVG